MPKLEETKRGREIGIKDGALYIWHACEDCGKERWIRLKKRRYLTSIICHPCSMKKLNRRGRFKRELSHRWKGGRFKDKDGYVLVSLSSDSAFLPMANQSGYVFEHRLVLARYLKKCLQPNEIVHHLNGIRDDNRLENLALTTAHHHQKKTLIHKLGERIKLLEEQIKQKEKKNQ